MNECKKRKRNVDLNFEKDFEKVIRIHEKH